MSKANQEKTAEPHPLSAQEKDPKVVSENK
jgi:hypothetical protein